VQPSENMPGRVKTPTFSNEAAVEQPALSGLTIAVFAVACGLAVGNLYYAQPLLETIGAAFGVSEAGAAALPLAAFALWLADLRTASLPPPSRANFDDVERG
jgi:hypothetical protein